LNDPSLFRSIRTELNPQNLNTPPTIDHLINHCPLLHSTLSEVLRLYTSSASMRYIATDTPIGKHILRAGHKIMIPYRQLHEHSVVWGSDALVFNPRRFLDDKNLKRNASYRPFGGGATLCAGRFVAMQEVLSFIGLALHRYDIELMTKPDGKIQAFPRVDSMKPTFGMMGPIEGDDYLVKVTKR
jgi:cytochrome P450